MSHADPARENIPLHLKIEKSDVFVGEPIGRGLSGSVYRGKILSLDKDVAVKVFKSKNPQHIAPVGSADHNAKYTSEIAMLATLRHPNIVEMIGYCEGERGDETYILLELAKGSIAQQSLVKLRTTNPVAHMLRVLDWCHQVAEGLQYLHRENVLHLDLKPSNILLFEDNKVKICDFGISKLLTGERDDTTTAPKAYTARYTSPETRSHNFVSRESDLFSLGCVMLELITGLPPWHHLQSKSALHALYEGQVPSLDDYVWPLPCPKDVQCLAARLLKCDADARASIEEAIEVLKGAVDAVKQQHLPEQPLSRPLDFNWLDGIAECSSLEVAVALLAYYRAPFDRPDAHFSSEDIRNVIPHPSSQLGNKFGTASSDEWSLLLYTAQSPVFKILNAALSENNRSSLNLAYASPMIKRIYHAIQTVGTPYSGSGSRVLKAFTPALIDAFNNFSTHYAVDTPIERTQFASFKKDLFTAESLNAASIGDLSVPLIIFNCDNIAGFDISAFSTSGEGEVIVLPPSYFTVSQPPYKVQQAVFVHLTFHADRSRAATYLRAQPQQASQASATTQRAQAVPANGIKHPQDQLSLTEVLAELAKVAELRKELLIQEIDPGDTELHTAAQFGNVTAIKALLQLGAKLSAANDAGATPLFKAAQHGHSKAIHALWEFGADVGVPTLSGVTPLLAAVLGNHADAINVLQDCGADPHERVILTNYPARFQPILFAILSDNASALTALLHHKIDPNTSIAITVDGLPQALTVPLLYIAATLGNIAIVNALINFGADVDVVSGDGSTTALHAAAHANHVEVVKALMVHSRNVDESETTLHKCPPVEFFAMVSGHVEVVKELQKVLKQVSEPGHRNYFLKAIP